MPDSDPVSTAVAAIRYLRELEGHTGRARDDAEQAVIAAHRAGASWSDIAEAAGEPVTSVKWLGVRSQQHVKDAQTKTARKRAAASDGERPGPKSTGPGVSVQEAAAILGITAQAVYKRASAGTLRTTTNDAGKLRILGVEKPS